MSPDLYDISHHNTISDWGKVDQVPIVHKVNEGKAIDTKWVGRAPIIAGRSEIFGGYTVLIVSSSTIRQQIEMYARHIEPHWRDGAFTQLDVEPWEQYPRPVNCDEICEAAAVHDELLGPDRCTVYINPNQMPGTFHEWHQLNAGRRPLWLPNYSANGANEAQRWGATLHQYTDKYKAPGFSGGIDANKVLDRSALDQVCNLNQPTPPPPGDDMKTLIYDTVLRATFTVAGDPVSPELHAELVGRQGYTVVEQDHEYWRAATLARLGGPSAFLYGQWAAEK